MIPTGYVIIIRGLPGSGKSTHAHNLHNYFVENGVKSIICSNDNYPGYYDNPEKKYQWTPEKAKLARKYCMDLFAASLKTHQNIIVDNTNLNRNSYGWYQELAKIAGFEVSFVVFEPSATIEYLRECAKRNTHNVTEDMLYRMLKAWEK
jgi:tRNA uridine 5-carbamoylmethylation protein Kti12